MNPDFGGITRPFSSHQIKRQLQQAQELQSQAKLQPQQGDAQADARKQQGD